MQAPVAATPEDTAAAVALAAEIDSAGINEELASRVNEVQNMLHKECLTRSEHWFYQLLPRLLMNGSPVWGLTTEERAMVRAE